MFDYFFLVLVGEDDVKTTYATKSISVDGLLFKADTVAAIDGRELFLLAIKLLHYKKAGIGRKWYILTNELGSGLIYCVVGCAWLKRATIREATDDEKQ